MVIDNARRIFACLLLLVAVSACAAQTAKTFTVSKSIRAGNRPLSALLTPDGSELYVSNGNGKSVTVIDTATDAVTLIVIVGAKPDALAVSPDGTKVYVGQNVADVSVIDTATKQVTTIATGGPVRDLAITPDGAKVYLAMEYLGLKKIDTSTNSVSTVSTIECPEGVAVTPDGKFLYVNYQCYGPGGHSGHDAVGKFDIATDTLLKGITGFPNVGEKITVSPDGSQVWTSDENGCSSHRFDNIGCPVVPQGVVNLISTSTDTFVQSIAAAGRVTVAPDNSFVVLGGSQLQLLTPSTSLIGTINIPGSGSLAVTADGTKAYAPIPSQNVVTIINIKKRSQGVD
ncbi:MAG TPA: YncE family protein [Terriglobales bacterium]|jgi:YVTN family beta-propeller protein